VDKDGARSAKWTVVLDAHGLKIYMANMKHPEPRRTLKVALLMVDTFAPITILGPMDVLNTSCQIWPSANGGNIPGATFQTELVSLRNKPLRFGQRVALYPDASIATARTPDLILIPPPALGNNIVESIKANRGFIPWIKACSLRGARVFSFCSGSFLLAETGLLNGRTATTHWLCAGLFRQMYPNVHLQPERLIVDEGNVITSSAAMSFQDVMLYIIELYCGREAAILTAKILLVDVGRQAQLPFTIFSTQKTHNDRQVLRVQGFMESQSYQRLSMKELARSGGMSMRNFDRRFRNATGESPSTYMQKIRIEKAKRLLETSTYTVEEIMSKVGYEDSRSFHRLFRAFTTLSPKAYRLKYGMRVVSDSPLWTFGDRPPESRAKKSVSTTKLSG
jgi:transcriptional regulator GlxA family with amidase domain